MSSLSFSLREDKVSEVQTEIGHLKNFATDVRSHLIKAEDEHQLVSQQMRLFRDQVQKQTDGLFHDLRALLQENYSLKQDSTAHSQTLEQLQNALMSMRDENRKLQQQRDGAELQASTLRQQHDELLARWESAASKYEEVCFIS